MADVHDKKTRSYNMSQVKGKNTKPEILVRQFLHAQGFRFRLHVKELPGRPDIVLPKYKAIILVQGCFWHGHEGCKYAILPKTNLEWWQSKIDGNIEHDKKILAALNKGGWRTVILWTCQLKPKLNNITLQELVKQITI